MKTVVTLLEIEVARELQATNLFDCAVLPGQGDGTRPDRYVSVVVTEAVHRGYDAHLLTVELRVVGSVFGMLEWIQETQGKVYSWLMSESCPLKCYSGNGLEIFGHSPANITSSVNESQRAEIIEIKVGASVDTPV
jgi:hypothetical protein